MAAKISIVLSESAHPRTKLLADELLEIIPDAELNSECGITLSFIEDVGPQFLVLQTVEHQFVFKIIGYRTKSELGIKPTIKNECSQLVLNNFTTDLGLLVADGIMKLFPINSESNQVVNFSVHKDFIFFRIYRFCFKTKGLAMQNIGPHLTLRLWRMTEYEGEEKRVHSYKKYVKNLNLL